MDFHRTLEFKGEGYWNDAADDRKIGKLWVEMSNSKCLVIMYDNTDNGPD